MQKMIFALLGLFISMNTFATPHKEIYFKTREGEEIQVFLTVANGKMQNITFSSLCTINNGYCMTQAHTRTILEDFIRAGINRGLYSYRYVPYDPCMDPRNNCTPHGNVPEEQQSYEMYGFEMQQFQHVQRTSRRPVPSAPPAQEQGLVQAFLNSAAVRAGVQAVDESIKQIANLVSGESGQLNKTGITMHFSVRKDGKKVPTNICIMTKDGCQGTDEVKFKQDNNKTTATYPAPGSTSQSFKRYTDIEFALRNWFQGAEYECKFGFTGVPGELSRQAVCYYRP
ncbi:hypothetical protein CWB99_07385 [Pseudoalteromonas rubra]|uniref:Uncharacterized protein n=1 Tax=Pseudoalteromonas rubra TaxID=43658 RepID=A0A5S3WP01_9GAMM|nr:hypothetical protein [Pseudoalteromonas rubra]TMP29901.1 hypothetical protein CWB99_07385 [Pseudoalteromonas rubra]TMP32129.1 hypothetical protein CWC00_13110 [Pseudoalteromonas rubra]